MSVPLTPIEVFYSFADADVSLLEQLEHHLSVLRQEGQITPWHKRQISAGSNWNEVIDEHLNTATLILLLISPDFLASDYLYGVELQRAMQRYDAHEAQVIPIVLRACNWENTPFSRLQVIPRNREPVTSWHNQDEAFTEIAKEIRLILETTSPLIVRLPQTTRPKIWQIPYARNPVFTGREDLLRTLVEVFQSNHTEITSQPQIQAISGLGGVGKTQLAVEYAYRTASQYQAVFWVNAETQETLLANYATLALTLNLQEKAEPDQKVMINAVHQWLQTNTRWLLILDNADDLSWIQPLLPTIYGGNILLTTRAQVTVRFAHRLEINALTQEEGALLLFRRAGIITEQGNTTKESEVMLAQARQISIELGGLPLALDQAGAYIDETKCDLQRYWQHYQHHQAILLARRGQFNNDHPHPVATTWSLSFEQVELKSPLAAQLLRFCAFLASDSIPEELLILALISGALSQEQESDEKKEVFSSSPAYDEKPAMSELESEAIMSKLESEATWLLDEATAVLRTYSLIKRNASEKMLLVHKLVQFVLKDQMDEATRIYWSKRVVYLVNAALPPVEYEIWPQWERILAHAFVGSTLIKKYHFHFDEAPELLQKVGWYLMERVRYDEAEPLLKQALSISKQVHGLEHINTARDEATLAHLYGIQGKYSEAEPLLVHVLAIRKQQLEPLHPDTANSLNELAMLYQNLEKYAEAEVLCKEALAIWEQQLGATHTLVATSLNNLAMLYKDLGKYSEAEPLLIRALAIQEQQRGPLHPDTAYCLNNLAMLYKDMEKYTKAEALYKRAFEIREQQLGPFHPETASSLNNLAMLYKELGKYAKAEDFLKRSIDIDVQQLGSQHPSLAMSLNNLAIIYKNQRKYAEAESSLMQAIAIRKQTLGPTHTDMAISFGTLAQVYMSQNKYTEAELLLEQAYEIFEQRLGPLHRHTATCLNDRAGLYQKQEKYTKAKLLYERALAIYKQQLGNEHSSTVSVQKNYDYLLQVMASDTKAITPLQKSTNYHQRETTRKKVKNKMAKQSRKNNRTR